MMAVIERKKQLHAKSRRELPDLKRGVSTFLVRQDKVVRCELTLNSVRTLVQHTVYKREEEEEVINQIADHSSP